MTLSLLSHSRISSPDSWKEYTADETFLQDWNTMLNKLIRLTGPKTAFYFAMFVAVTFWMAIHPLDTCLTFSPEHLGHVMKFVMNSSFITHRLVVLFLLGTMFVLGAHVWFSIERLRGWWNNRA